MKLSVMSLFFAFVLVASVVPTVKPVNSQGLTDEIIGELDRQIYPDQSQSSVPSQGSGQQQYYPGLYDDIISDLNKKIYPDQSPQTQQQLPPISGQPQFQPPQTPQTQQSPSIGQSQFQTPQMQKQQSTGPLVSGPVCVKNTSNVLRSFTSGIAGRPGAGELFDTGLLKPGQSACGIPYAGGPAYDTLRPGDNVFDHFDITLFSGSNDKPPCKAYSPIQFPSSVTVTDVPLDPGNGGRSIDVRSLRAGDIIVSTTNERESQIIRFGTNSPVSHSMMYVGNKLGGNNQVIEAVGNKLGGVRQVAIETALADSHFAVAFRYPGLTQDTLLRIMDYARNQLGKNYNYAGVIGLGSYILDKDIIKPLLVAKIQSMGFCPEAVQKYVDELYQARNKLLAHINLGGTNSKNEWFCSELICASFASAGAPLTNTPPGMVSPGDLASLQSNGILEYVGHLKTQ